MDDKKKLQELQAAFVEFTKSTEALQRSYDILREEASKLNKELEESNNSLKESLSEQERLRTFLEKIIQNIPGAVVVIDQENSPMVWNESYVQFQKMCNVKSFFPLMKEETGTIFLEEQHRTLRYKVSPSYGVSNLEKEYKVIFMEDIISFVEMEEKLKRKERLASMGEMAASIAHEIRNPLGGIKLFGSMLDKEVKENPEQHEMTQHIIKGVNNIESIIKNMLFFAKEPEPVFSAFPINRVIQEVIAFYFDTSIYKNITFKMYQDKDIIIEADKDLVIQVLHNLFLNAIQASVNGLPVAVSLKEIAKKKVEIIVADQGKGIPKEQLKKFLTPSIQLKHEEQA